MVAITTSLRQAPLSMAAAGVGQHGLNEGIPLAHSPLVEARLDHAKCVRSRVKRVYTLS